MDLRPIIAEIVSQAEDFPAGDRNRGPTRARILELIQSDYFHLDLAARQAVTKGVMATLQHDDFFGIEFVGPFDDEDEN